MLSSSWQSWLLVIIAAISTCVGNLLLKKFRMVAPQAGLFESLTSPWFLSALVFLLTYLLLFTKALDKLPISSVYPVFSGIVFSTLMISASIFLGERLHSYQFLGLGIIVTGIVIVSRYS
jgi:multidrug transporter EmrE-like cation transporter